MAGSDAHDLNARDLNARDLDARDLDFISRLFFVSFVVIPFIDSFSCPRLYCHAIRGPNQNYLSFKLPKSTTFVRGNWSTISTAGSGFR